MRKQFTIFLILVFVFGLVPVNFSAAITQNQIDAEVQIVCTDGSDNWFSGSGTIIDPKGIILTNRHVVEGAYMNTCFIGFIESISQEPNFGTAGNYNLAEVKYQTISDDMDAAILYLDNPTNKTYPYINIWDSNSDALQFGDKIEVIGFPSIGGSTITYTSGDFSGFGSNADGTQNYIKSTAPLEHGNSGGASYNPSGQFIGIPTMVVAGTLNSMSYVLSVNSIKGWLGGILGSGYQDEVIEQEPVIEEPTAKTQEDITPPDVSNIYWSSEIWSDSTKKEKYNFSFAHYDDSVYVEWPVASDDNGIKGYYVYWGLNRNANPVVDGDFQISRNTSKTFPKENVYYLVIQAQDNFGNLSSNVILPYYYGILPDYIQNDPVQYGIITNRPNNFYIYDYSNGTKGQLLKTIKFNSAKEQAITVSTNNIYIEWDGINNKDFITKVAVYFDIGNFPSWGGLYENYNDDYVIANKDYIIKTGMNINTSYKFKMNQYYSYDKKIDLLAGFFDILSITATKYKKFEESSIVKKLKGSILLQVESHGEAYYIYPEDSKRYYLGRPADAFNAMRKLGLGATHEFITSNTMFPDNVLGKILLDVEQNGEAYYIYPKDKKAYYLGRPADAFRIMRELGLGITNSDLSKILEGEI